MRTGVTGIGNIFVLAAEVEIRLEKVDELPANKVFVRSFDPDVDLRALLESHEHKAHDRAQVRLTPGGLDSNLSGVVGDRLENHVGGAQMNTVDVLDGCRHLVHAYIPLAATTLRPSTSDPSEGLLGLPAS